jgi:hypothetical protein
MRKIYTLIIALFFTMAVNAQNLIYANNFEDGVGAASIVGSGQIIDATTPGFGKVFHNAVGGQSIRTNYLLLSDTIFTALQRSNSFKLTIGFWVNKGTATDFHWSAIFSAYGAAPNPGNTWPMMALMTRGWAQINCSGWCDFTNGDNVAGTNEESSTWIDNDSWHFYTATFDTSNVKIYIDGVIKNAWTLNGTDGHTIKGLFTNGSDLKYICLGGNQAWTWGDPDPAYMFDEISIYSSVLTKEQIDAIIAAKRAVKANEVKSDILSISPNPASNYIKVKGIEGQAKVTILGLNGKIIKATDTSAGENISLAGIAKGTYIVKVITKNNTYINKVVVK